MIHSESNSIKLSVEVAGSVHILTVLSCYRRVFEYSLNCAFGVIFVFGCFKRTEPQRIHHFLLLRVTVLTLLWFACLMIRLIFLSQLFLLIMIFIVFALLITRSFPLLFKFICFLFRACDIVLVIFFGIIF